jgi:signal recognition particle receptor subunit beta
MVENLIDFGEDVNNVPIVLQYNKRDLFDILTIEELQEDLNPENKYEYLEAIASDGINVVDTLKIITKLVVQKA